MIDKNAPVLAFDVSKGSSHCQGFLSFGEPSCKPFKAVHSRDGMEPAAETARVLEARTGRKPKVALEATGVYSRPVVSWAESLGLEVFLISPLESAKVRKSRIRPTKTDSLDCGVIAEVAYTRELRLYEEGPSAYSRLKALSRRRSMLVDRLVKSKNQYRKNLDCVWPLLDEICDPFCGYALWAVAKYRHPSRLAKAKAAKVAEAMAKDKVNVGRVTRERVAARLVAYAKGAIPGCPLESGDVDALVESLGDVEADGESIKKATDRMVSLAKALPQFAQLVSIDGFGDTLAALFCAELGDPSRFHSRGGIVAYAGIDPTILQSGRTNGLHYAITRKGNPFLRKYLYVAVENMLMLKADNPITRFYAKKKGDGLCHKAAAMAACRKLLVAIWGMLRNGTLFKR